MAIIFRVGGNGATPQSGKGLDRQGSKHGNMILRNLNMVSVYNTCSDGGGRVLAENRSRRLVSNSSSCIAGSIAVSVA